MRTVSTVDPVLFYERELGGSDILPSLDPWQMAVLRDPARNLLVLSGRQCGKSTVSALLALSTSLTYRGQTVLLVSPSLRQSKLLFQTVRTMLEACATKPEVKELRANDVQFANGSKIVSLPGRNSDSIRGYANVALIIEDESAYVLAETHGAIRPMMAVNRYSRHVMVTTPNAQRGHFYKLWTREDLPASWSKHSITTAECTRISAEWLKDERDAISSRLYRQEYECAFLAASNSVLSADWLEAVADHRDLRRDDDALEASLNGDPDEALRAGRFDHLMDEIRAEEMASA